MQEHGLIRKLKLIWKFLTSQTGQQIYSKQFIYCPISQENQDNQVIRRQSGNSTSYLNITCEIFFIKHHAENNAGRLVPDHFLNFKKALYKAKASGQHLGRPKLGLTIKTTLYNITGY